MLVETVGSTECVEVVGSDILRLQLRGKSKNIAPAGAPSGRESRVEAGAESSPNFPNLA